MKRNVTPKKAWRKDAPASVWIGVGAVVLVIGGMV